jgi:hypothetical protein
MPISEKDIWRSAAEMIKAHGENAWDEAVKRYFDLKENGDTEGMAVWRRVARAIDEFSTINPGESLN